MTAIEEAMLTVAKRNYGPFRDIEARYVQDIKLKGMVKRYLKMPLENMDEVNERLENG